MSRKKTAELDTPFSSVEWPAIPQNDQDTILELLCDFLAPIGQHRRNNVASSRGKRSRRREKPKGKESGVHSDFAHRKEPSSLATSSGEAPPPPELASYVDVGLANITRVLADSTASSVGLKAVPDTSKRQGPEEEPETPDGTTLAEPTSPIPSPPYAAVFIVRSGHPSAFYSHFPQMVAAASRFSTEDHYSTTPTSSAIRLVGFSRACEERLSACLGIPRVSSIALRAGAPQSQGLVQYLREHVTPVEMRWLTEAESGQYRETQIHISEVPIGQKKKQKTEQTKKTRKTTVHRA